MLMGLAVTFLSRLSSSIMPVVSREAETLTPVSSKNVNGPCSLIITSMASASFTLISGTSQITARLGEHDNNVQKTVVNIANIVGRIVLFFMY
jgi:hypothetical protein